MVKHRAVLGYLCMGLKLVGALIEDRDIEIMRSGVEYVVFKGSFVDFYFRCCGFVYYCNTVLLGNFL